ncbi:MAG: hypothetical protein MRECE_59c003 [Mycoplasmataceae bacterium CE_OT135]|nr:MAG: hypothetical protein MRECE_59c003 [Mycoplasmataceae bacterium CE_OT135]
MYKFTELNMLKVLKGKFCDICKQPDEGHRYNIETDISGEEALVCSTCFLKRKGLIKPEKRRYDYFN